MNLSVPLKTPLNVPFSQILFSLLCSFQSIKNKTNFNRIIAKSYIMLSLFEKFYCLIKMSWRDMLNGNI